MFQNLKLTIESLSKIAISENRKQELIPIINYLQEKYQNKETIRLHFICTHNSRRSQFGQIWAKTLAHYFGIKDLESYSGGTEVTALFPMVAETIGNQGFVMQTISENSNPIYSIKYDTNELPIIGFSKKTNAEFNPESNFIAIMTCSSADTNCPIVMGAEKRFSLRYDDPKESDGTPFMRQKYGEKSLEIASEWYYILSKIKQ